MSPEECETTLVEYDEGVFFDPDPNAIAGASDALLEAMELESETIVGQPVVLEVMLLTGCSLVP
jgi:hypothetical protein